MHTPVTHMLEDVLGCKWSWNVLGAIYRGVHRPGQMEREIAGISTKVLNERLRKWVAHGVLSKTEHAEIPPRVEYHFTEWGKEFFDVLRRIESIETRRPNGDSAATEAR